MLKIFILLFISSPLWAMEISGNIDLKDDWQPVVFLAALNSPEDLFVASPDFVIAETFIQPDGSFNLKTQAVSEDLMFYRLYLVRGDYSSLEFNTNANKNYLHLLLNRNSLLKINAVVENNALQVLSLSGSEECQAINDFDKRYTEKRKQLSGQLTRAKSNFLTHELELYIRNYTNEAKNALVGLYALYHIEGKDTDFLRNSEFYFNFEERLNKDYSGTVHTQAYSELLKGLVGFREFVCEMPGVQPKWKDRLILIEAIVIFLLLVVLVWVLRKLKKDRNKGDESLVRERLYEGLTSKQQEILKLLAQGKTNKEIAQELFVELSTVKTHINNVYRQLGVGSRQEAASFYLHLKKVL